MALRLEGWLGVKRGGRADLWIAQQAAYDLWQARKAGAPKVKRAPKELEAARASFYKQQGVSAMNLFTLLTYGLWAGPRGLAAKVP